MKKIYLLLTLVMAFVIPVGISAATPLPARFSGTMMPYDFSRVADKAVWPDSLSPVYVAHVARHGARYMSSDKKLEKLRNAISECRAKGSLTPAGENFSRLLDSVASRSEGKWGALSEVGRREEVGIARNLYSLMPSLFRHARLNAISSYVPRVVMTMYEFCHELSWLSSDVQTVTAEGKKFDPLVRCFEADSLYDDFRQHDIWRRGHESYLDSMAPAAPASRLFGKKSGFSDKELRQLTMEIYDILQSLAAFGMPPADDEFMTEKEYESCWRLDNTEHYLRNADTPWSDLAGKASSPLLARIITDADASLGEMLLGQTLKREGMHSAAIAPEPCSANLYFGHAETLMPLLSLMQVEGCHYESADLSSLADRWVDSDIVPLGAHLDVILLASPSGKVMAALMLNGRFLHPMEGSDYVVSWEAYRDWLLARIREV